MASPLSLLSGPQEASTRTSGFGSPSISDNVEVEGNRSRPSRRIPNEILLAILAQCSPSTLAAFAQTSFAFLEVASPLLYDRVTISRFRQATLFFHPPPPFTHPLLPRIDPYVSRSQTNHLVITAPSINDSDAYRLHPLFPPPTGPLLLKSFFNPADNPFFNKVINPSLCTFPLPLSTLHVLAQVTGHTSALSRHCSAHLDANWDRLEDLVFTGFYLDDMPPILSKRGKNCRFTMDLSMLEQKVDPRNPKGSSQRVLEGFAKSLGGSRGRVWVGSEEMREMFELAKKEVAERLKGDVLEQAMGRITVEIKPLS